MTPVGFFTEHCCISWLADVLKISFLELTYGQGVVRLEKEPCFICP